MAHATADLRQISGLPLQGRFSFDTPRPVVTLRCDGAEPHQRAATMPRTVPDRVKLIVSPYHPPPLKKGDKALCYFRDGEATVTEWTDARISWPRGYIRTSTYGRETGLIVEEELCRAVRSESAAAVAYW